MKSKKSLIVTFAAVAAISLGGALTMSKASAAPVELNANSTSVEIGGASYDLTSFRTYGKASVRLIEEDSGIRFVSGLDESVYEAITAADAVSDEFAVTFGTIVTYYSRVTKAGAFTMEALDTACEGHLPDGADAYVDCPAVKFLSDEYKQDVNDAEFTAVLQVAEGNYDYELCARAYLKVEEGAETTYYYAQYDSTAKRTPAGVAQSALAEYAKYADNLTSLGVLKGYMTAKSDGVAPENEFILPKTVDSTIETVEIGGKSGVTKFSQVENANQWANRLETRFLAPSVTFGEVTTCQRLQKLGLNYMTLEFYYNDNFNVNIPTAVGHKVVKLQNGTVTSDYEGWQNAFTVYDADGNYTTTLTKNAWYTAVIDISAGVKDTLPAPQVAICLLANNTTAYFANPTYYATTKCFDGLNDFVGSTTELTLHLGESTAMGKVLYRGAEATAYDVTVADGSVATYANGLFTPVKVGETTATVSTAAGSYTLTLKVTEAYVQAANAEMFTKIEGFADGAAGSYGAYASKVGGREGVYVLSDTKTTANWTDKLAVAGTERASATAMTSKGYEYVTFDVYFEAGMGIYVYAPDGSKHTALQMVEGKAQTRNNAYISMMYNGVEFLGYPETGRWYTIVVKYVPSASGYQSIEVNHTASTAASVYFDNLRYYYNDSFLSTDTDYVQKDGSEFVQYSQTTGDSYLPETEGSTVYTLKSTGTDWNTRLVVKETNMATTANGGLGSSKLAANNMWHLGYQYVTFAIRLNAASSFGLVSCASTGSLTDKFTNGKFVADGNGNLDVYDQKGQKVAVNAELTVDQWYTVVVKFDWDGTNWSGILVASNGGGAIDVSLDNVRYYLNDSWKTDLGVTA